MNLNFGIRFLYFAHDEICDSVRCNFVYGHFFVCRVLLYDSICVSVQKLPNWFTKKADLCIPFF
jgi:hypothetical protein